MDRYTRNARLYIRYPSAGSKLRPHGLQVAQGGAARGCNHATWSVPHFEAQNPESIRSD
jgi:hypothetical protein